MVAQAEDRGGSTYGAKLPQVHRYRQQGRLHPGTVLEVSNPPCRSWSPFVQVGRREQYQSQLDGYGHAGLSLH